MLRLTLAVLVFAGALRHASADDCQPARANARLRAPFHGETSLQELVTWAASFSCKTIVISSEARRRASRVEVISAKALSPRQALQLFVDAVEATGLVIQQKGDTIIIKPGPGSFAACDEPVVHGAPSAGEIADDLIAALGAGVRVRGPMLREIDRALLDRVLAQPIAATRNARILPAVRAGRPIGFTLEAIDPAGVLARLGFANGDTVLMVDGVPLTSAERALEAYARLRGAKQIEVAIERRGAPAALVIVVN